MNKKYVHLFIWLGLFSLRFLALINDHSILLSIIISLSLYGSYALAFYTASSIHKKFYENRRFLLYTLLILLTWIGSTILLRIISRIIESIFQGEYPIGIAQFGLFRIMFFVLFGVLYQVMAGKKKTETRNQSLLLEKRETELLFLKSQMNPHFFFNTLNNIYGLAYRNEKSTPTAILKLSEAMRYIIYETQSEYVSLNKELNFIDNYIELERLRLINKHNLKFVNEAKYHHGKIAPLILLPFVENCFKHSNIDESTDSEINISIWIDENLLNLSCGNTISKKANHKEGGIGTQNVIKRLKLLYDNRYHLITESNDSSYFVHLTIPIEI